MKTSTFRRCLGIVFALILSLATSVQCAVTIKLRGDTAAGWTTNNPVLALREPGVETDTRQMKVGDGVTAWNSLQYTAGGVDLSAPGPIGATTPSTGQFTTLVSTSFDFGSPATGQTGEIGLQEDPTNGNNIVTLKAPSLLADDLTIILPAGVVPASSSADCTAGQWWYDSSYWYVCVATNTWRRAALEIW